MNAIKKPNLIKRNALAVLAQRLREPRNLIQILLGPRQVGKTTLALQLSEEITTEIHYTTADDPSNHNSEWLKQCWQTARIKSNQLIAENKPGDIVLIIDEIQKIPNWSSTIKFLWDEDTRENLPIKVLLLGSAPLLIQKGLSESLSGRFETIPLTHWSYEEMKMAFGLTVEEFIFFGGYPKAASFKDEIDRWRNYIIDSLIETTLSRDILSMTRVDKPALLRNLFLFSCHYSGQIISYQKMLGQLHDVSNTTTLSHYLNLLANAGMVCGLQKYSSALVRQKSSSPKIQIMNTALMSAENSYTFDSALRDRTFWGRLVETAVGAHLVNSIYASGKKNIEVFYWREGIKEVDFVVRADDTITAIEVKSGFNKGSLPGLTEFSKRFNPKQTLLIGDGGLSLEDFFLSSAEKLFFKNK